MARERAVTIKFLADAKEFSKGTQEASKSVSDMSDSVAKHAGTLASAFGAAKIVEFGKASVEAAMDDAKAQTILATTLKNTTGATDDQIAAVEDFIAQTQGATGVLDDELRPAFQNLVRVTKDTTDAQDLLTLAMDISASTGKDLESVSMALAKAHEGSTGKLKALGIETKDAEGKARSFADIQAQLTDQFGGAQAAAADTAAGKMQIMQARYADLQETIGAALLPIMSELVGIVSSLLDWFSSLDEGTQAWIIRIAMLGSGLVLAARAISGVAETTGKLGEALGSMSAKMGIALGVVGLAAGLYFAYSDSKKKATERTKEFVAALQAEEDGQSGAIAELIAGKLATDDLQKAAAKLGLTSGDLARVIVGQSVPGFEKLRDVYDEWYGKVGNDRFGQILQEQFGLSFMEAQNLMNVMGDLSTAYTTAQTEAKNVADTQSVVKESLGVTEEATTDLTGATDEQADADKEAADAAKAHEDAVRSLFDAIVGAADKTLGYRDAQRDARTATDEYVLSILNLNNSNEDQRTTLEDVAVAMDDAQEAMMGQAQAAADLYAAQLEANGATLTAGDRAKIYRDELANLSGALSPGDPLRNNIEGLIADLGRIPANVNTTVTTTFSTVGGSRVKDPPVRASGGRAEHSGAYWIGENGPELFIPDMPGSIVSNQDSKGMAKVGSRGDVYNVNVSVTGSVVTERQLVDVVHEGLLRKQRSGRLGLN